MTISFEYLLVLGVVGFYVFDSAMLLFFNELVFVESNGRWNFTRPRSNWQLLRKTVYVPNPLTPDSVRLRVLWSVTNRPGKNAEKGALERFVRIVSPIKVSVIALLGLMIIWLPVVLLIFGPDLELLALLAVIYSIILFMLLYAFRYRKALGLNGKELSLLAFEMLACPPFALNFVQKLSELCARIEDPIQFAHGAFDSESFNCLIDHICKLIDERLQFEPHQSSRYFSYVEYRQKLLGLKA